MLSSLISLDFSALLSDTTLWKRTKILSNYQRQKSSLETVASGDSTFTNVLFDKFIKQKNAFLTS